MKHLSVMKNVGYLALLLAASSLLFACGTGRTISYPDYAAGFTGASETQLRHFFGTPKEKTTLADGNELWEYSSSRWISVQVMPAQYHNYYDGKNWRQRLIRPAQYRSELVYCHTSFYLESERVSMWRYEGNCEPPKNAAQMLEQLQTPSIEGIEDAADSPAVSEEAGETKEKK